MKRWAITLCVCAALTVSLGSPVSAQPGFVCHGGKQVIVGGGFYTGEMLNSLKEHELAHYVIGYVDAYLVSCAGSSAMAVSKAWRQRRP